MEKKKLIILIGVIALVLVVIAVCVLGNQSSKNKTAGINSDIINDENGLNQVTNNDGIIVDENEAINSYLYSIYFGTETYMPEFKDINSADEKWIWECAYRNLVNFDDLVTATTVTKENVEESAKQLFGNDLNKEFPKEGLEFWLEPEGNEYFYAVASIEQDFYNDYSILSTENNGNTITVEIVEYKYNEVFLGEPTELNLYKFGTNELVKTYSLASDENINNSDNNVLYEKMDEAITYVEEHPEEFSTAKVTLKQDESTGNLYVVSVER